MPELPDVTVYVEALDRRVVGEVLDVPSGKLVLTEQGSKRRTALDVIAGSAGPRELDHGGLEALEATAEEYAAALQREGHTIKRALMGPTILN